MSTDNVQGFFVSEKINKVRWKPEEFSQSETFISGSWDNEVNTIKLWSCKATENNVDIDAFVLKTLTFKGDVTEIQFINANTAIASSSEGYAILLKVKNDQNGSYELTEIQRYDKLHYYSNWETSSCTALALYEDNVVTVGEDGRVNLLNVKSKTPVQVIENADSCSLRCVCFTKHNEVLTGNMRGQMKIWDLRSSSEKPRSTFILNGQQIGATAVTHHPSQRHLILTGSEDGVITVWDLRKETFPITSLDAHASAVSEMQFHPNRPEKLFSCSASGELWMWNPKANYTQLSNKLLSLNVVEENIWLSNDLSTDKLEVISLMSNLHLPTNSLNVNRDRVICGCDNEAIYVINYEQQE